MSDSHRDQIGIFGSRGYLREAEPGLCFGGLGDGLMIAKKNIGNHVKGCRDAEELLKAFFDRSVGEGRIEVDFALFVASPSDPQVPLAHHCGAVSVGLQEARQSDPVIGDQWAVIRRKEDAGLEVSAPAVTSGQESVAGGSRPLTHCGHR